MKLDMGLSLAPFSFWRPESTLVQATYVVMTTAMIATVTLPATLAVRTYAITPTTMTATVV